jgi:hypothetical protein
VPGEVLQDGEVAIDDGDKFIVLKDGRLQTSLTKLETNKQILLGSKILHTDPQLRQELQILLISTSHSEFPSSLHPQHILAGRQWMHLFNHRRVHQHRSMNSHKPVQIQLFLHG